MAAGPAADLELLRTTSRGGLCVWQRIPLFAPLLSRGQAVERPTSALPLTPLGSVAGRLAHQRGSLRECADGRASLFGGCVATRPPLSLVVPGAVPASSAFACQWLRPGCARPCSHAPFPQQRTCAPRVLSVLAAIAARPLPPFSLFRSRTDRLRWSWASVPYRYCWRLVAPDHRTTAYVTNPPCDQRRAEARAHRAPARLPALTPSALKGTGAYRHLRVQRSQTKPIQMMISSNIVLIYFHNGS